MRCSMVRSLLQGIQRNKNVPCCRTSPGFNSAEEVRSIRMSHSVTQANSSSNTDECSAMMALWPGLVKDLTEGGLHPDIPEVTKWMAEVLNYIVPYGKKHRGLSIIYSYRMLAHPKQLTDENLKLARVLAWCHEIHQVFLQVQDDLIDRGDTRRGRPCWHLRDNIGVTAVNDSLILEQAAYQLLKTYFHKHGCYLNLIDTFTEMTLKVALGQVLDISSSQDGKTPNMNLFTMDKWNLTAKYRGSHYCFVMPVKLAMHFAGVTDPEMYRQTEPILLDMGHLYTVQNDYLDFYGDPDAVGYAATDIERGKCSWLVLKALEHATPIQRKILEECYGHEDPEKVACVKQVYNDLDLATIYANYEEKVYNSIKTNVEQLTCDFPEDLFDVLLTMMYRRTA